MALHSKSERGFFRRLLVDEIQSLKHDDKPGKRPEKRQEKRLSLKELYVRLGYLDDDERLLKSKRWWKRLDAVIRLEIVQPQNVENVLRSCLEDPDDFVALAAMRALSNSAERERTRELLSALSRRAPSRRDLFLEILTNIGKREPHELLGFLKECFDPLLATLAIEVIGNLKMTTALEQLEQLTLSSDDQVAAAAVTSIGKLKSKATISNLRALTSHPSALVRVRALGALLELGDQEAPHYLKTLRDDPSIDVRRAAFEALREAAR